MSNNIIPAVDQIIAYESESRECQSSLHTLLIDKIPEGMLSYVAGEYDPKVYALNCFRWFDNVWKVSA